MSSLSLFIFHRDLRLDDNIALLHALETSKEVLPIFILDTRQVDQNPYKSPFALQFMQESLRDLDQQLKKHNAYIHLFYGTSDEILSTVLKQYSFYAVYSNRDYSPYSQLRDSKLREICVQNKVKFEQFGDALLNEPELSLRQNNRPYTVFTPFFRFAKELLIQEPKKLAQLNFFQKILSNEVNWDVFKRFFDGSLNISNPIGRGGRSEALTILNRITEFKNYSSTHDIPALHGTTRLSAHLKFGTVSIRETYHVFVHNLGRDHPLVRQLYWRDFFTHIAFNFPHIFGHAFRKEYDRIKWENSPKYFQAWCDGCTGFPIIDAGIRELKSTGFMHNRVRMIVSSFLVKDLHIDWRWGEKFFAQYLIDYDPAVNNGNWQWAASTGCDAQPYFRIFNPWTQQRKFDPECQYIKRWIPELNELEPIMIHNLENSHPRTLTTYPTPIVNHSTESKATKALFRTLKDKNDISNTR